MTTVVSRRVIWPLSQTRVIFSEEELPGWTWTVSEDVWDERYGLVKRFAAREGHSRVPQKHVEDGIALGKWVSVQRAKRDALPPERRAKLEALPGWTWKVR